MKAGNFPSVISNCSHVCVASTGSCKEKVSFLDVKQNLNVTGISFYKQTPHLAAMVGLTGCGRLS